MNPVNMQFVYAPAILQGVQPPSGNGLPALALAIRSQDPYTRGHSRRVAGYAQRIAQRLDLSAEEIRTAFTGGLLHDIGKIAFSRQLLKNTDARLSEAMQQEIRLHPEIGFKLLGSMRVAQRILEGVRYHHERINGTGYPCGLLADEIPLSAKIISVADCYDALTTNRPYQRGKSRGEALTLLETLGGITLDGQVIQALCAELREGGRRPT
jgi:putative nucleotidyltransferase with HDIG domain